MDASAPTFRSATVPPPLPVSLIEPDPGNRSLESARPMFVWKPVEGATAYRVRLVSDPLDIDVEPATLQDVEAAKPRYIPETSLEPGARFVVEVQPLQGGAPFGPAGSFRFHTLSEPERSQAAWARNHAGKQSLAAAMVLYRLGRYAEAQAIAKDWPEDAKNARWKTALDRAIETRRLEPGR
jgi:hypothetical protein